MTTRARFSVHIYLRTKVLHGPVFFGFFSIVVFEMALVAYVVEDS